MQQTTITKTTKQQQQCNRKKNAAGKNCMKYSQKKKTLKAFHYIILYTYL